MEVGNANVDGIALTLTPGMEISGRVRAETGELQPGGLQVLLRPMDDTALSGSAISGGQVNQEGGFTLRGVDAEAHGVEVLGLRESWYVKSARIGDREWADGVLGIPAGGGALEIVLSPNGGQVDGVVLDDKQQPAAGAKVALAPDEARRGRADLYKTAVTDQYGRFTMRGIAPGDYKLFAWAELEPGAAQDPEFLKPYEKAGEAVSVKENGREAAQLKLLPVEER